MSSPPKTPPYPDRAMHPFPGFGISTPYPNFSRPSPHVMFPTESSNPPPPGFVLTDPVALSYPQAELNVSAVQEEEDDSKEQQLNQNKKLGNHRWVGCSSSSCTLPDALLAGHDIDGSQIYIGRAYHNGDMIPAKVIPSKQIAYVAYGGEEIIKDQFEVLVMENSDDSCWSCCSCLSCCGVLCFPTIHWIPSSGGHVPGNAVSTGTTADGEPLYIGRVHHDGAITPGKIQPSHGCCYYPFNGEERCSHDYEALVIQ